MVEVHRNTRRGRSKSWWLLPHQKQGWEEMGQHKDTERKHTQTLPKILDLVATIFSLPKVYFYHFSECVSAWGSVNVSPGTLIGPRYWISWSWSSRLWAAQCGAENQASTLQEQHALLLFLYRNTEFNSHVGFWCPTVSTSDHCSHYALS